MRGVDGMSLSKGFPTLIDHLGRLVCQWPRLQRTYNKRSPNGCLNPKAHVRCKHIILIARLTYVLLMAVSVRTRKRRLEKPSASPRRALSFL